MPQTSFAPYSLPSRALPALTAYLLTLQDLPSGFRSDDALANADATARSRAYAAAIGSFAFVGFRSQRAAVVEYAARTASPASARAIAAAEADAVGHTRDALFLTLAPRGDGPFTAYQQHGSRGQLWVMALFTRGPLLCALGSYSADGEQSAIDTAQRLSAIADARLGKLAAALPHRPTVGAALLPPTLTVRTMTHAGRDASIFAPHTTVYWRVDWYLPHVAPAARETILETVTRGSATLYHNQMTDRAYSGLNALVDHLRLSGAAPGSYRIAVTITTGTTTLRANAQFSVAAR